MEHDNIIEAARIVHKGMWKATSDESTGTRNALKVTKKWQERVRSTTVHIEKPVGGGLNEKMDVVGEETGMAYEMKVSGKNADQEFYKDIFKVLAYNRRHPGEELRRLVFITEDDGADSLKRGLAKAVGDLLAEFDLDVEVVGIGP